ncbi:hypothetical protein BC830DRAFT_1168854 [Chytriomyces sp. MP71]|nr:hypothetical protein BC830DRAFT_1168854 [Chytriomyces sp. MP71]
MSFQIYTAFEGVSHEASSPSLSAVSSCATSCFSIASNASSTVFFGPGSVNLLLEPSFDASSPLTPQTPSSRLSSRASTTSEDSHVGSADFSISPKPKAPFKASSKFNRPLKLTRDFTCTECPLSFHRNHDLRRHNRSVHGIGKKTFVCKGSSTLPSVPQGSLSCPAPHPPSTMSKLATKMAAVSSLRNTKDARCRATAAVLPPLHSGFTLSSKLAPLFKGPGGVDLCLDDGSAETGFELPSPTVPVLTHSSPCSSAFGYAEPTPEPMELSPVTYSGAPDFMVVPHVIGKHCTASPRFEPSPSPLPLSSTALSEADPSRSPSASEDSLSEDESSGSESIYRCSIRGCKKGSYSPP